MGDGAASFVCLSMNDIEQKSNVVTEAAILERETLPKSVGGPLNSMGNPLGMPQRCGPEKRRRLNGLHAMRLVAMT